VGKSEVNKDYDPACGSGSLLLKFEKILGKENVRQGFFGQEINITTYNLMLLIHLIFSIICLVQRRSNEIWLNEPPMEQ